MRNTMYIVINEDLNMSPGKIGAHTAHAVFDYLYSLNKAQDTIPTIFADVTDSFKNNGDTIIVLKAHEKVLLECERRGYTAVRDRGLTEVEPDSITAVCLGVYDKDEGIPKWIQKLRLL